MTSLVCPQEVVVRYGNHIVTLRPSLRAAMTLERLLGGWSALLLKFDQFHTSTMHALIRASAVSQKAAEALLLDLSITPLKQVLEALEGPLLALVGMFLCLTNDVQGQGANVRAASEKPLSWNDAYSELYQIGTGWLGWTPKETWAATPTEITEAFTGKIAMLKAIHGSSEEGEQEQPSTAYTPERLKEIDTLGYDPAFDRGKLQGLKARLNA